MVGIIFSIFSAAFACVSLCLGKYLEKLKYKRMMIVGNALNAFVVFLYIVLKEVDNEAAFISIALLIRIGHGCAYGII
jgi:MFS family permease